MSARTSTRLAAVVRRPPERLVTGDEHPACCTRHRLLERHHRAQAGQQGPRQPRGLVVGLTTDLAQEFDRLSRRERDDDLVERPFPRRLAAARRTEAQEEAVVSRQHAVDANPAAHLDVTAYGPREARHPWHADVAHGPRARVGPAHAGGKRRERPLPPRDRAVSLPPLDHVGEPRVPRGEELRAVVELHAARSARRDAATRSPTLVEYDHVPPRAPQLLCARQPCDACADDRDDPNAHPACPPTRRRGRRRLPCCR